MRSHLVKEITEVWHIAASTSFDDAKREEIIVTNVGGTSNLLDVVGKFDKLSNLFYMSTAYVAGKKKGVIPEGRIEPGMEGFKNPYEETKLQCENMVRDSGLPFTILRPSIIMGNSRDGDAKGENRMIYGYLLALYGGALHAFNNEREFKVHMRSSQTRQFNARLFGGNDITKNIVTLDDVVNVCVAARAANPKGIGRTYNVVNPQNITVKNMNDGVENALRISGYKLDPTLTRETLGKGNYIERAAYRHTKPFWPYMSIPEPDWQQDNVQSLGVNRVLMSPDLFSFMMKSYVCKELLTEN